MEDNKSVVLWSADPFRPPIPGTLMICLTRRSLDLKTDVLNVFSPPNGRDKLLSGKIQWQFAGAI